MKFLYNSDKKSGVARRWLSPDGEYVIGSGKPGEDTFPLEDIGKYPEVMDTREKTNRGFRYPTLNFEKCEVGVYEARLKVSGSSKGGQGVDKVYFDDIDTGAYYSMSVGDVVELLNGIAEGIVKIDKDKVITAKVFPFSRGQTTFLSVFTKEMEDEIREKIESTANKKASKIKPKDFIIGNIYSSQFGRDDNWNYVYCGKGRAIAINNRRGYSREKMDLDCEGHLFVMKQTSTRDNKPSSRYNFHCTKSGLSVYKDLGVSEISPKDIINEYNQFEKGYQIYLDN